MMKNLMTLLATAVIAAGSCFSQSSETFYTIRLEDPTTNNTITLAPPSLTQSYALTLPTSAPTSGPTTHALMFNRITQSAVFGVVPMLNASGQQVTYLDADGVTLRGSSGLLWDTVATRLSLTTDANTSVLSVTRSTASTTPLATFSGGNVGVGTTTPNTALDVDGDFAVRELNYTAALASVTNNNFDFGNNNRAGYVRLATTLTADRTFTGFVGGRNGKEMTILNRTGRSITILNESTSSVDTARVRSATDDNVVLPNLASMTLLYSAAEQRWRISALSPLIINAFTKFEDVVAAGDTEIPVNRASYIKITTSGGNRDVTFPNGLTQGQILVIQNLGPARISLTGTNIEVTPPSDKVDAGDALFLVWDGSKWQVIARKL